MLTIEPHKASIGLRVFKYLPLIDTASIAIVALVIGIVAGEIVNRGYDVLAHMVIVASSSAVFMFGGLSVLALRYERRKHCRTWVPIMFGFAAAAVIATVCNLFPPLALEAAFCVTLSLVSINIALQVAGRRRGMRKCCGEGKMDGD